MTRTHTTKLDSHVSLIERAGIIFAFIIALGLTSLIGSMLVIESLEGDAAQINTAGSLRMQSIRLSRALTTGQSETSAEKKNKVDAEVLEFERRLTLVATHGLSNTEKNTIEIAIIHTQLKATWEIIKNRIDSQPIQFKNADELIDGFVQTIDSLVLALQRDSEKKVRTLRIIHGSTLFLTLFIAFIALYLIHKNVVQPMNHLVRAAREAGKGNFSIQLGKYTNDEIGLLANTFNGMSKQLGIMRDQLEDLVRQKTQKLEQSNRSLELLYRISHNLALPDKQRNFKELLKSIENTLGTGHVSLNLDKASSTNSQNSGDESQLSEPDSFHKISHTAQEQRPPFSEYSFPITNQGQHFGKLLYSTESAHEVEQWQVHLLHTFSENIATAFSLDKQRTQENLLLLLEERTAIARELHDSLAQSLSYLKLQTGVLDRQIAKSAASTDINATITDLKEGLSSAYRQLRELLTTFRLEIEEPTLVSALKGTIVEFSSKCKHPVELNDQAANVLLTPNEQIHILQIVREALSNIQRHAQASHAWVELLLHENLMTVSIRDNGIGLPETLPSVDHYGLSIMRERALLLNASIEINNLSDGGTIVTVTFKPTNSHSEIG